MTYFFETPENEQYAVRKEATTFSLEGSESVYTRLAGQFSGRTLEPMKVDPASEAQKDREVRTIAGRGDFTMC